MYWLCYWRRRSVIFFFSRYGCTYYNFYISVRCSPLCYFSAYFYVMVYFTNCQYLTFLLLGPEFLLFLFRARSAHISCHLSYIIVSGNLVLGPPLLKPCVQNHSIFMVIWQEFVINRLFTAFSSHLTHILNITNSIIVCRLFLFGTTYVCIITNSMSSD